MKQKKKQKEKSHHTYGDHDSLAGRLPNKKKNDEIGGDKHKS